MAYNTSSAGYSGNTFSSSSSVNYITGITTQRGKVNSAGGVKTIVVSGNGNAVFYVIARRTSDGALYNFETDLFSTTPTSKSRLKNQNPGSFSLTLPSNASGDTYTVEVFAEPHFNTEFSFGSNKLRQQLTLTQSSTNVTATFATTALGKATATTLGTFTGVPSSTVYQQKVLNQKQISFTSHADDYGLFIIEPTNGVEFGSFGQISNEFLYYEETETVNGAVASSSNIVVVDSVANLGVGMELTYITGTTAPGSATTITAIDTSTKTLTLSRNQALDNDAVMTFRAYGPSVIAKSIGMICDFKLGFVQSFEKEPEIPMTTTVRTALTENNTTVNVKGTLGFGVGTNGVGKKSYVTSTAVENSGDDSASFISGVSGSVTEGTITLTNATFIPCEVGTVIYGFITSNKIYITGDINIFKYPAADATISLDLSKFLTAGTNS